MVRGVSPALETLLLTFSKGEVAIPKRALFLGAEPHPELKRWPEILGWQPFKPMADAWERAGFARVDEPTGAWPMVLVLPGKSRDETLAAFAKGYDLLEEGGTLVVAMTNISGASRFEKELAKCAGNKESLQKNKCRSFHSVKDGNWNQDVLEEWRKLGEPKAVSGTEFIVEAGVFSPDHIDPGSALLAEHLPTNLRGSVADLGAGWGFLSHVLMEKSPDLKALHLFEADARSLNCARKNVTSEVAEFHWHDVATGLPGKYEAVISNPPFHSGNNTDIALGRRFLRAATDALRTGGRLFLVANRQLPYEAELEALGLVWRKPVEEGTYKLLFAEKRLGTSAGTERSRR